jgi:tetratricopeptide (TPR) repeat protein
MKKKRLLPVVLAICLCCFTAYSQNKNTKKEVKKVLKEAQYYLDGEDYFKAWRSYKQVLTLDPKNDKASVNAAVCAFNLNYMIDSTIFLVPNLTVSKLADSKYYLAKIKHQQRAFDEAIKLLEAYVKYHPDQRIHTDDEASYLMGMCINGKNFVSKPHLAVITNMGPNINTFYPDYVPVIVPDESAMYFTSKREGSSNNKRNGDNRYFEDVYVSYNENGVWQKAVNIGEPINSETNDGCVAISPDGQRMIVYRTSADIVTGDLYTTQMGKNGKWEPLQLMPKQINSEHIETSACFSNDTAEIYFSSDRPEGFGGKDLYRLKRLPNGQWSTPYNLGPTVNTKYDEDAPFLHPDGVSLYFSSKGHNTMGDYDIFKTIIDKENNKFSTVENLEYPINDVGSDIFFVLSVDGQRGYYSSLKEKSIGSVDIYKIDTRFKDNELRVKHGVASIDGNPGRVKIILSDENDMVVGAYLSNPQTGKFILVVNPMKSYKVTVEAEGCQEQNFDLRSMVSEAETNNQPIEIKMKKTDAQ